MKSTKKQKSDPFLYVGFKTNNGHEGSFDVFNPYALQVLGTNMGALDPTKWSFHVHGDLYQVPFFAREGHESGGSVNASAINLVTGESLGFSHVFFIDTTGHGRGKPNHWNHQLYIKRGDGDWTPFDKKRTECHEIPDSDSIIIWAKDSSGKYEEQKVEKIYREKP